MLDLYKTRNGTRYYWWAWETVAGVVVQSGAAGKKPKIQVIQARRGTDRSKIIARESRQPRTEGYQQLSPSQRLELVIRYEVDEMGDVDDLDKRHHIEELLDESLTGGGLGFWTRGEIGNGEMTVWCSVIDVSLALPVVLKTLKYKGLLQGAVIEMSSDEEEKVLWPPESDGS